MRVRFAPLALTLAVLAAPAWADDATFTTPSLTPETALKAAQAALKKCRADGFQVAVSVVDRAGVPQVLLRDRYAGAHTPNTAFSKAWTTASFRTNSIELEANAKAGGVPQGIGRLPGVALIGGGRMIEAGGALAGAIGVSGAPAPTGDDACAQAGIDAISGDLL